jgi:hypothetical protein
MLPSYYLTEPWKDPPFFKFGKSSISMGHPYHGYVCHNQTVSYWLLVKTVQRSSEALIGDSLFQFSPT